MEAKELKQYIAEDKDRIYKLLENAGFHNFTEKGKEIRCALPDYTNKTAVMVKTDETLYTSLFELGFNGDLFGALGKVLNYSFREVMDYVSALLGISNSSKKTERINPLSSLERLAKGSSHYQAQDNTLYDKSFLNKFIHVHHRSLIEEGISGEVLSQFDVMFDPLKQRIIFPHYDWNKPNKLVGVKGRTIQTPEEIELFNTPKYWNYIKGYRKMNNLYGWNQALPGIQEHKKIILFEGEKSVLKQFTFERGNGYSVALGGHAISTTQVEHIMKYLPADTEVVLAFDKDVMTKEEEGLGYILSEAKKFQPFRKVSYIYDQYNILGEKDSPIDKGYKAWNVLLKWRRTAK